MRHVLLDFDLAGFRLGLTIDGLSWEVVTPEGVPLTFAPGGGLDALPMRSAPIIGSAAGDQTLRGSISVGVRELWANRLAAPIQLGTCRVYWWPEGEALRPEHELFRGVLRDPTWDLAAGQVGFSIAPDKRSDDRAFPPSLVDDEGRFPHAPDEAAGFAVPVVYGRVAGLPLVAISSPSANPVNLLVAGHRVHSTTIRVGRAGATVGLPLTVLEGIDGLGAVYSYVQIAQVAYAAGSDLYATEVEGVEVAGRLVTQLGAVLEHLVRSYGPAWGELDRARVEAARSALNRISVGFFVNDRQGGTLTSFLQGRLAGQFPISISFAGGRLGWDSRLLPREGDAFAVERLTFGQDTSDRVGPSETSADDVLTDIEMTHGFDGYQAGEVAALRFSPENSGDARRSASRWGRSPVVSISAPDVSESASAFLLLTDQAARLTRVRWRVEYQGLPDGWYFLPLQSVVLVTDAELGWTDEPCLLEAAEARADGLVDVVLVTVQGA